MKNTSHIKGGQTNTPNSEMIGPFCVSSINKSTRRIMCPDKLFFEMRLERSTAKGSSFGRIMRLWVEIRATDEER